MLKYFGLSLILVVAATFAPAFAQNLDNPMLLRIVGGDRTDISHHPFQISLQMRHPYSRFSAHVCGGSIITRSYIFTAAHCVGNYGPEYFIIEAGSSKLYDPQAVRVPARHIIKHELFKKATLDYDVALVMLSAALPDNNRAIAIIPLATKVPPAGTWCSSTGWGDTSHRGYSSNDLLHVYLQIIDNNRCEELHTRLIGPGHITERMMCAGIDGVGGRGICQGDSGGPLVCDRFGLVGVVSWVVDCARSDAASVYANVAELRTWVRQRVYIP